jgi:hypothetical protein
MIRSVQRKINANMQEFLVVFGQIEEMPAKVQFFCLHHDLIRSLELKKTAEMQAFGPNRKIMK